MEWQYSRHMVPVARRLRRDGTEAEQALWERLRGRRCGGWRFARQVPVGPFVLDFYCPAARLVVEVDGTVHEEPTVRARDQDRQTILEQEYGVTFVRLTNTEVLQTPEAAVGRIEAAARQAQEVLAVSPPPLRARGRRF